MQSKNFNSPVPLFYYFGKVDENYVEDYTEKVVDAQNHQLDPLKQDLAVWINHLLGINYLNGENLLHELDNGAVLCHLALVITRRAKIAVVGGYTDKGIPKVADKYFANAVRKSFFSRDNMENFIVFCRSLGVHQNLLFESDDLVLHNNWRNVILCLLEVARLSTYYGIEPPNLVQFEKEVAGKSLIDNKIDSQISWQFQSLPLQFDCEESKSQSSASEQKQQLVLHKPKENEEQYQSLPIPYSVVEPLVIWKGLKDDIYTIIDRKILNETQKGFDELDRRVEQAIYSLHINCKCPNRRVFKLKIKKIGTGRYCIEGRNVYVRLLKDCHMMVRVGGGWDTFEHFLKKYDPCQANGKELKSATKSMAIVPNATKRYSYYSSFKKILRPGESAI